MAGGQRDDGFQEAVEKIMASEHADVIRESVAAMVSELMEPEVAALVGAPFVDLWRHAVDERVLDSAIGSLLERRTEEDQKRVPKRVPD